MFPFLLLSLVLLLCVLLLVLLVPVTAPSEGRRLVLSTSDGSSSLALGVEYNGSFVPVLSKPAEAIDLRLHAPIRVIQTQSVVLDRSTANAFPTIELSGDSPMLQFVDESSGRNISLVKPAGTRDLLLHGGGLTVESNTTLWGVSGNVSVAEEPCAMFNARPSPRSPPAMFEITSGGDYCWLTHGGTCVTDGVGNHGNAERCTVTASQGIYASTTFFNTETYWDYITIGGQQYSGTAGFASIPMAAQETFTWYTDGSVVNGGFEICGSYISPPSSSPVT